MITFKQFLESFKMEDQTFSDNNGTYSVPKIVHYATKNKRNTNVQTSTQPRTIST